MICEGSAGIRMNAIVARGIVKKFGGLTVLHGLDLKIPSGELFALLGPNGSGKTTLFRILTTLIAPDAGTAMVGGCDAVRAPDSVRAKIGVVFQSPSLDGKLTVRENLAYGGALYGMHGAPLKARIAELVGALRLEDKIGSLVETLSGGQQRRVEIAKCLLTRPEILLLDEPSTGLDPTARMDLWALLGNLRAAHGMTVVFTSHLMDESARADRVGIMCGGRLVCEDLRPAVRPACRGGAGDPPRRHGRPGWRLGVFEKRMRAFPARARWRGAGVRSRSACRRRPARVRKTRSRRIHHDLEAHPRRCLPLQNRKAPQ